jgi:hypothetical protein
MALQEHACHRRNGEGDDCGRGCQENRVDQGGAVARLDQDRQISGQPLRAFGASYDQASHRQHKERRRHHGKRKQT